MKIEWIGSSCLGERKRRRTVLHRNSDANTSNRSDFELFQTSYLKGGRRWCNSGDQSATHLPRKSREPGPLSFLSRGTHAGQDWSWENTGRSLPASKARQPKQEEAKLPQLELTHCSEKNPGHQTYVEAVFRSSRDSKESSLPCRHQVRCQVPHDVHIYDTVTRIDKARIHISPLPKNLLAQNPYSRMARNCY